MVLVKRMNQRLRVPDLSSPLVSAQATLPAGYSPVIVAEVSISRHNRFDELGKRKRTSNANANKESPGSQHVEHANRLAVPVGASGQSSEDNEDDGGHEQRVGARPEIGQEAKKQLSNDGADKGNVGDILAGVGRGVDGAVLKLENGVDRPNDVVDVAVGEETGTASKDGQGRLEEGPAARADFKGRLHCCCCDGKANKRKMS